MPLFKKKVSIDKFLAEQIAVQFELWEDNSATLIDTADEAKVLTDDEKRDFLDKIPELIVASLVLACNYHLGKRMPMEKVMTNVLVGYSVYLRVCKELSREAQLRREARLGEFYDLVDKAEEGAQHYDEYCKKTGWKPPYQFKTDLDKARRVLCMAFALYCVGTDLNSENYLHRQRAALELAGKVLFTDTVGLALKEYSIRL